jgi:HEAT repeat protein
MERQPDIPASVRAEDYSLLCRCISRPEANASSLAEVSALLDSPVPEVRRLAAAALTRAGAPTTANDLVRALEPTQPEEVRAIAAIGIAQLGPAGSSAILPLCRCLTSGSETLRNVASLALYRIGPEAVPALSRMLQFSDSSAVTAALLALSRLGPTASSAFGEIRALAARGPVGQRLACAAVLMKSPADSNSALNFIYHTLQDPEASVRQQALSHLGSTPECAGVTIPWIVQSLRDPVPAVRYEAALGLGRIQTPGAQAVPALLPLLRDPAPEVRTAALTVLASHREAAPAIVPLIRELDKDPDRNVAAAARGAVCFLERRDPFQEHAEHINTVRSLRC